MRFGRVEEVDRVPGRRRVDDDQVVLAARVDLEEPFHRDVVVALHEARGEVVVQPVLEDAVRGLLVGRVAQHEVVPRLLGVEHRRPQLAARLDPRRLQHLGRDAVRARCRCRRGRARSRAGGPGRSSARAPCRRAAIAAPSAAAAATDVLPTPPEPQKTTISLAASSCSSAGAVDARRAGSQARAPSPSASATMRVHAQAVVAHEQVRHVQQREVDRSSRSSLEVRRRRCGAATPRAGPRRARRPSRCRPARSACSVAPGCAERLERLLVGVREQLGQHPVDDHRAERRLDLGAAAARRARSSRRPASPPAS